MKYEIWDPFEEMNKFKNNINKLFKNFGKISLPKGLKVREPLVDVLDKKNELEVKAELPGIDKKDIKISVKEDKVEIKAEKKIKRIEKKKNFYRQERSYTGFYKEFSLPAHVNPTKTKLTFKNGILTLKLAKAKKIFNKRRALPLK